MGSRVEQRMRKGGNLPPLPFIAPAFRAYERKKGKGANFCIRKGISFRRESRTMRCLLLSHQQKSLGERKYTNGKMAG